MQWVTIALCYLCLLELVLLKILKKHKQILGIMLCATFILAFFALFIWGMLRNF